MFDFTNKVYKMTFNDSETAVEMVMVNHVFHKDELYCIFAPKQSVENYNPGSFIDYRVCKCDPIPAGNQTGSLISFELDFEEFDDELKKFKHKFLEVKVVRAIDEAEIILEEHFKSLAY